MLIPIGISEIEHFHPRPGLPAAGVFMSGLLICITVFDSMSKTVTCPKRKYIVAFVGFHRISELFHTP
ncbi:hypothetical protein HMPREF9440_01559 [Sutterella parvirubra YIT 11816]|uniref:Uncharacterized protein n=1 Tax=Sutterella parvirubra YIT 11816 TaxID=762967 RepID=H3KFP0_9BURK|nr:hypothetical protein HMPREF9440_01559 [Sutterella parvirubra YIT 11816]